MKLAVSGGPVSAALVLAAAVLASSAATAARRALAPSQLAITRAVRR
jgi:hypothetical protein